MSRKFIILVVAVVVLLVIMIILGTVYLISASNTANKKDETLLMQQPVINSQPPSQPISQLSKSQIHLYPAYRVSQEIGIDKIHIISLLFVPKDINPVIKTEWVNNMDKTDKKIKEFFEEQFENKIKITYQALSEPVRGDWNTEDYYAQGIALEAKNKTAELTQDGGVYNVWMIYLVRDEEKKKNMQGNGGGIVTLQAAVTHEFQLDNEAGIIVSAHEFAHTLGIPHPWELPANQGRDPNFGNVPNDLMAYIRDSAKTLEDLYIRNDVKKDMGL